MFYEFNLLLHVGVVAERVRAAAAAAAETGRTKGNNTPEPRGKNGCGDPNYYGTTLILELY